MIEAAIRRTAVGIAYHELSVSIIIGVCGGSGSGKTTLSSKLVEQLGDHRTACLSFDSYYHDFSHLSPAERAEVNFDHPDSLDEELLLAHLDALRSGSSIGVPTYDFASHTRSDEIQLVGPAEYVVIEGILLFSSPLVRERLDHLIFRDCPSGVRFERRMLRDVETRGRTPDSVEAQWKTTVQPMHEIYVEPHAAFADLVTRHGYDLERAVDRIVEALELEKPLVGCLDEWPSSTVLARR